MNNICTFFFYFFIFLNRPVPVWCMENKFFALLLLCLFFLINFFESVKIHLSLKKIIFECLLGCLTVQVHNWVLTFYLFPSPCMFSFSTFFFFIISFFLLLFFLLGTSKWSGCMEKRYRYVATATCLWCIQTTI